MNLKPDSTLKEIKEELENKTNLDSGERSALDFIPKFKELLERPLVPENKAQRVEIIVLKYKSPEVEKKCLNLIIENTEWPYKLNVYDNRNNTANFAKIWNKLTRESTCEYVLIMDSDAFVEPRWLDEMMRVMAAKPKCAVAVPSTGDFNAVTTVQGKTHREEPPFEFRSHVSGFCFLFRKEAFEQIGPFDENFYMFGQDSDWFERILRNDFGWEIWVCPQSRVTHGDKETGYSVSTQKAARDKEIDWNLDIEFSRRRFTKLYGKN